MVVRQKEDRVLLPERGVLEARQTKATEVGGGSLPEHLAYGSPLITDTSFPFSF